MSDNRDPPEDDQHKEEDRGLGNCEGGVLTAIQYWALCEGQGEKNDGDDEKDEGEQLEDGIQLWYRLIREIGNAH